MLFRSPKRWPGQAVLAAMLLVAIAGAATAAPREAADAHDGEENRLVARLLVDPLGPDTWRIGVELVPDPGWHVYWRNPGDTGLPPQIAWRLDGEVSGPVAWPTPEAFPEPEIDLISYGYERPILLATTARSEPGARRISATVDALVCAYICLPGHFEISAPLDPTPDPAVRARFDEQSLEVPKPAAAGGVEASLAAAIEAGERGPRATLVVWPCGRGATSCDVTAAGAKAGLYPDASDAVAWVADPARPHAEQTGALVIDLAGIWLDDTRPDPPPLSGVVPLRNVEGAPRAVHVADLAVVPDAAALVAAPEPPRASWWVAALYAWIGGLILNLMPCVLPVLAIKLTSLASLADHDRKQHLRHASAYTGGIAVSMLALAVAVAALRAAGSAVGWGFQMQEPVFLLAISALLVAFAMNLFGVFEIAVDTGRLAEVASQAQGARRSFFDGLLAVALATPCSAPFLGTAVGFAFASPAPVIAAIFLAIGLGLATPFLLAAAFPGWARRLPRGGAWMGELRGFLGFALLATTIWLLAILGRVAGPDGTAGALVLLLVVAAVAGALGAMQRRGRHVTGAAAAVALAAVAGLGIAALDLAPRDARDGDVAVIPSALPFAPSDVRASLDAGRPVFVYFTADWCITCKVNERRVLADARVEPELARLGFDVYRADWTRRDDTIRGALARLGKAGVPVYALYTPSAPEAPRLLPELLTLDGLLDALRETADEAARDVAATRES